MNDLFPFELRMLPQWVIWRKELRASGPTKVPYCPNSPAQMAATNRPETWGTYVHAVLAASNEHADGVGFVFTAADPYCGVDLDKCINPDTGQLHDWALAIMARMDSYAEVSPSETGVHIIVKATLPGGRGRKTGPAATNAIEIYDRGRYFCVTGKPFEEMGGAPQERQTQIDALIAEISPPDMPNIPLRAARVGIEGRASRYLAKLDPAVSGQRGHDRCFHAAMVLVEGFGLSAAQALPLLREYSAMCQPPWSEREMIHKLEDAEKTCNPAERGRLLRQDSPLKAVSSPATALSTVEAIQETPPMSGSAELGQHLDLMVSGQWRAEAFPWHMLTNLSRALLPGTVTLLCGVGGASKSLFMRQAIGYWVGLGLPIANFELEDDMKFHLNRSLAQVSGIGEITNDVWCLNHPEEAANILARFRPEIDAIGSVMTDAPDSMVTLSMLAAWVTEKCKAGARIIVIDPITAVDEESKSSWVDEKRFLQNVKVPLRKYGASLVIVTHPRGKSETTAPSLDDLAGGRAWPRFSHTVLWMTKPDEPMLRKVRGLHGTFEVLINRTIRMLKTRNGAGGGIELGFNFDPDTLRFSEEGAVIKEKKRGCP